MKVLVVNTFDGVGGAAKAALRIHQGLRAIGTESTMLVGAKSTDVPHVIAPPSTAYRVWRSIAPNLANIALKASNSGDYTKRALNVLPSGLHKIINRTDADVVNLHWVSREFISIKEIAKIEKPIVWTLHDMWSFCSTEQYEDYEQPGLYVEGYEKTTRVTRRKRWDLDRRIWRMKKRAWRDLPISVVAPSRWMAECAKQSVIWRNHDVRVIHNGIDLQLYRPYPKHIARELLGLPQDKQLILFGALFSTGDKRKGYDLLVDSFSHLEKLVDPNNVALVVFGARKPARSQPFAMDSHYLGQLHDDLSLALVYSAADVFVAPSMQENLANTLVEAAACGLPAVAFNIGGMPDLIEPGVNGYLARPFDSEHLAQCIAVTLQENARDNILRSGARKKAQAQFELKNVASQYLELFQQVANRQR